MIPFWIYQSAFVLQLLVLALFLGYAARAQRGFAVAATWLLSFSALLQLLFTLMLAFHDRALPLGNAFEALNFWALIFSCVTLLLEIRYQIGLLGVFLVPFSALLLLMGFRFEEALPPSVSSLGSAFLLMHVGLPMAGYAFFSASAGLAIAWLVAERQLKQGHLSAMTYRLPALETLERAAWRSALAGFALLGLGLAFGFFANPAGFMEKFRSDATVLMSLVTLGFYGGLLLLRAGGQRGRRFALLLLLGYVALFFAFYLVNIYWGGHSLAAGAH